MTVAAYFWLAMMIVFIVVEASTVSVVSLWFAAGALASLITDVLGGPLWLQVILFVAVSGVLLILLRPITKKYFTPKLTRTNVDAVVGTVGTVLEEINNNAATGRVKLGAMEWTARSTEEAVIPAGTLIRADKVEGVKVFVTVVKETQKV